MHIIYIIPEGCTGVKEAGKKVQNLGEQVSTQVEQADIQAGVDSLAEVIDIQVRLATHTEGLVASANMVLSLKKIRAMCR